MLSFENLQTPPGDGDTLVEPAARHWPELIERNIRLRSGCGLSLAGHPFEQVLQMTRRRVASVDVPVVAAGHQPGFVHPGVWAKHVVVHRVAGQTGARGIDLVVDHDAPRSAGLVVPVVGNDRLVRREVIDFTTGKAGSAYEGRVPLEPAALRTIHEELAQALGERLRGSLILRYLDGLAEHTGAGDAVDQHLAARAAIDAGLGADLVEHRVSHLFGGPFLADLLINADRFAAAYNDSLADYRQEHRVRGTDRPLPDLGREDGRVEAALWTYRPGQPRRRLWVERLGDRVDLYGDRVHMASLSAASISNDFDSILVDMSPSVVRPRALTLTLWARLLACDLFVHGIGGAKYDRITDGIIARYYRCRPAAYTCVSATLRLALPRYPVTRDEVQAARRRLRDWGYNPQRYMASVPEAMLEERQRLIAESDRRRAEGADRTVRRGVWQAIRRLNSELAEREPAAGLELARQVEHDERQLASNQAADWREYFYLLQPRDRLEGLASRLIDTCRPASCR